MIENIPFNTARRIYQNNYSEKVNYETDKNVFTNYLLERGYDSNFVKDSFKRAESLDKKQFLEQL
jgi:spore germination protein GerM